MTSLHTPGPWLCLDGKIVSDGLTTDTPIARVYKRKSPHVAIANARLIEAAPELLAALQHALRVLDNVYVDLQISDRSPGIGLITARKNANAVLKKVDGAS